MLITCSYIVLITCSVKGEGGNNIRFSHNVFTSCGLLRSKLQDCMQAATLLSLVPRLPGRSLFTKRNAQRSEGIPHVLLGLGKTLESVCTAISMLTAAAAEKHAWLGRVIGVVVVPVGLTVIPSCNREGTEKRENQDEVRLAKAHGVTDDWQMGTGTNLSFNPGTQTQMQ